MSLFNQSWSRQMASPARPALSSGWKGGLGKGFGFGKPDASTLPATSGVAPMTAQNQGMAVTSESAPISNEMSATVMPASYQEPQGFSGLFNRFGPTQDQSNGGSFGGVFAHLAERHPHLAERFEDRMKGRFGFGRRVSRPTFTFQGNA